MLYRGPSVGSHASPIVSRIDDLSPSYDSPMTNGVIAAFQNRRHDATPLASSSPAHRGLLSYSSGQASPRYGSFGSAPGAFGATQRNVTIGEFSREPSYSPPRAMGGSSLPRHAVDSHRSVSQRSSPRTQVQPRPLNVTSRDEVLGYHGVQGLRSEEFAPAAHVHRPINPPQPRAPFPIDDEVNERGLRPEQQWAPAVRVQRPKEAPDAFDRSRLSPEALSRLQQRLSRGGIVPGNAYDQQRRVDDVEDVEDEESDDGDDPEAGAVRVPLRSQVTDVQIPDEVRDSLAGIVSLLSSISRRRQVPEIPQHVLHAYHRRVYHGAYFVKFPERGNPHQRFFRLHAVNNEIYGRQPYMEYTTHAEAISVKGRVHLAHLAGINAGTGHAFSRFLTDGPDGKEVLKGPIYEMNQRTLLESDFAFTVVFVSTQKRDLFSLLTLDQETFHCWVLVLRFLASINVHLDDSRPGQEPRMPGEIAGDAPIKGSRRNSAARSEGTADN